MAADSRKYRSDDPTLVRNQVALTRGRRRRWLIPGGILAAIVVILLLFVLTLQVTVPLLGIIVTVTLFAAMVVAAVTVPNVRQRNIAFAWLMGGMAAVGLVSLYLLVLAEWSPR